MFQLEICFYCFQMFVRFNISYCKSSTQTGLEHHMASQILLRAPIENIGKTFH